VGSHCPDRTGETLVKKNPAQFPERGFYNKRSQPISPEFLNRRRGQSLFRLNRLRTKEKAHTNSRLYGLLNRRSQPISRVLSWTVIRLGLQSLTGSSNLPVPSAGRACREPIWSCFGWSLPCHELLPVARCALTAPFHPYLIPLARAIGGLLSVALVVGSRLPGVTWHPAL